MSEENELKQTKAYNLMFKTIVSAALAFGIYCSAATVQAAPAASGAIGIERAAPASAVEATTYRRHRHRHYDHRHYGHRRYGHRHYGHRHYSHRRYGFRPGIYLNFGGYGGRRH